MNKEEITNKILENTKELLSKLKEDDLKKLYYQTEYMIRINQFSEELEAKYESEEKK